YASPFLEIAPTEWFCSNALCFAIPDHKPASRGHLLIITRRHVATWFDCTLPEQNDLMALVNQAKTLLDQQLDPQPDGYQVLFNSGAAAGQTVHHAHVHLIPRYADKTSGPCGSAKPVAPEQASPVADNSRKQASGLSRLTQPGSLPSFSLTVGHPAGPLWPRIANRIPGATEIDLVASFAQSSGLDLIRKALFSAYEAGARIRLLVGDYLCITSPDALRTLFGWMAIAGHSRGLAGHFEARLVELEKLHGHPSTFHPKAWRIADATGGIMVVGSSNLSRSALTTGVEWNLVGETAGSQSLDQEMAAAFEALWCQATPLSAEVITRYSRRAELAEKTRAVWDGENVPMDPATGSREEKTPDQIAIFSPRPWQTTALESLATIRHDGYTKALVAVATGLGKTWLAAFDLLAISKSLGRCPRVLVIAHRAEILAQAEGTLRQALDHASALHGWPPCRVSWYAGDQSDLSGSLVIASIQKLSRRRSPGSPAPEGLAALDAAQFDYCVIDEVHHAEAPSYRRVLARLRASFTLGLTATPDRTDGVDIATLFDDILAAQATIGDGITEGSLVPFRYRGLKDDTDFEQIPWRNGRFDPLILEEKLANSARMERLWVEWLADAPDPPQLSRTPVVCCSRRHALFTRDWLRHRKVAAAALFSESVGVDGPRLVSDPRMASLAQFREGSLEALCVVDLFNEGLDVPQVSRVVMLRPTESKVIFLQQLGRGLRAAEGKTRLSVIDFVGNHKVFASRLMHVLALGKNGQPTSNPWEDLKDFVAGRPPGLPPGCTVDLDMEAKELLQRLVPSGGNAVVAAYRLMRMELERRPTPAELVHAGYLPLTVSASHDSWLDFCRGEGDLDAAEQTALDQHGPWFRMLQTTSLTKSYKMVVLRVLLDRDAIWDGMEIGELALACRAFLEGHPLLRADLEGAGFRRDSGKDEQTAFSNWWFKWPLSRWMDEQAGKKWFALQDKNFAANFGCPLAGRGAFEQLTGELVDCRLAQYARSRLPKNGNKVGDGKAFFVARVTHAGGKPSLILPRVEDEPGRPMGPITVRLPDGKKWLFRLVKMACNSAGPKSEGVAEAGRATNQLGTLLRDWFGENAGLPGTRFEVKFTQEMVAGGVVWSVEPIEPRAAMPPQPIAVKTPPSTPLPAFRLVETPALSERYEQFVPVYNLQAAAGFWGAESVPEEIGWAAVPDVRLREGMFMAQVQGSSMEPLIHDRSWCLFRRCPGGSREGRIVLVQFNSLGDPENGGRFTVKKYHAEKVADAEGWRHGRIQLLPLNPEFQPIELSKENASDLIIVGEYLQAVAVPVPENGDT
ncbi:MAG: DEAD/DEAH box helicase family protein, partial [Planctomycetota bacterium]|nr:DEAD/DEAH box helicase family protein [Planctomycetota bacterium]